MTNKHDLNRNAYQLFGKQAKKGYDWWWHSFTAYNKKTKEAKPFFIEFFLINPAYGKEEPVFGQLKENKEKGLKPSYLMVKAGAWGENAKQLHRFFGWKKICVNKKGGVFIDADDCHLEETCTRGKIEVSKDDSVNHPEYMSDYGSISWDLKIEKSIAFNVGYGASKLFRKLQLFEMFWHAEGIQTFYSGTITLDGEEYSVSRNGSFGYADKNWGKNFTSPWVWLSSCNIVSNITHKPLESTVFDIGGGRPKIGPIALNRKLLSAFTYQNKDYEFNFSKFWTFCRTKFNCYETEKEIVWNVVQKTWRYKMEVNITCEKKDMLLVNYESPDGMKRHNRLWNGGNGVGTIKLYKGKKLIDDMTCKNVGCEYGVYDK